MLPSFKKKVRKKKMKNRLIESYIKDNNLEQFTLKKNEDFLVQITDGRSTMDLIQCFNFVIIAINGEVLNTYEKKKIFGGDEAWVCVPSGRSCL